MEGWRVGRIGGWDIVELRDKINKIDRIPSIPKFLNSSIP